MEARLVLQPEPASAGEARRFVRRALASEVSEDLMAAVELLTSEVVTNLILHVGTAGELVLHTGGESLRVEVVDHYRHLPVMQPGSRDATSGRGLRIVDALSRAWGVEEMTDNGKTVWFELDLRDYP